MYNVGGNIVTKNEYVYTEETVLGTPTKIYAYTYGNGWRDQLASYDGSTITYDDSGNPTSYLGVALTWTRGRLLNTYSKGRTTYTMKYNAHGVRTSKIKETPSFNGINLETTNYTYDSEGRLRRETRNAFERIYLYSSDGIIGYEEDGEKFLYRKNLFGDVTAIYQGTDKVAEYFYDAWGNCSISASTTDYAIASANPIRYRGYYFDQETGWYFLNARYYSPEWRRFISPDDTAYLSPKNVNGLNLYAYCNNKPIVLVDPDGHFAIWALIVGAVVATTIFTTVVGAVEYSKAEETYDKYKDTIEINEGEIKGSTQVTNLFDIYALSMYIRYFTDNSAQGSAYGLALEWSFHNLGDMFGMSGSKEVNFGATIHSDFKDHHSGAKILFPIIMSTAEFVTNPIAFIYDLLKTK